MSDEVGYGKPPKSSQFRPGQSGNPKGRPKGARNFKTEVREVMKTRMTVTQNGKQKRITTRKAMVLRLTEKALSGNNQSMRMWLDLARDYDEDEVDSIAKSMSPDDASILEMFAEKIRSKDRAQLADEEVDDDE